MREPTEIIPLSFGQERLWFLDQLRPGDSSHHLFTAVRLSGPLDARVLESALTEVVARHEPLRARFPARDGGPVQEIAAPAPFALEFRELDAAEVPGYLAERTNRPFDLAAGPLIRAHVARLGPGEHVLCLVVHHIVCDGWSLKLLLAEVSRLYAAFTEGKPSPLPPLPARFADFARSQRARDDGGTRGASSGYWRDRLAGAPPLDLPTDRPRPAVATTNGATLVVPLPPGLMDGVRRLAASERCTSFMVLMAAYQALLARYSGQDDLCVGSAIGGRDRLEYETLVGYFAGTLVFRGDLSGDPAFGELLQRTRAAAVGVHRHQDVPFELLLTELGVERDLSRAPLFQTMLVLHDMGETRLDLPGVRAEVLDAGYHQVHHDLVVDVFGEGDERRLVFTYNTDLFERGTVAGYASALLSLLAGAVADPGARLSALFAAVGNDVAADVGGDLPPGHGDPAGTRARALPTLVETFATAAARTPDAVAVTQGPVEVTYAGLRAAASRVAGRLRAEGAGRGTLVAVFAERSVETIAGFLGTLTAGAAYVPLDPDHPAERIAMVLRDSGATIVLAQAGLLDRLPPVQAKIVSLEPLDRAGSPDPLGGPHRGDPPPEVRATVQEEPRKAAEDAPPAEPARPEDPAYVLYTSGSTGRPKGVVVSHRALSGFLAAMSELLAPGPSDVWLAVTSPSFDISGLEMYLPLTTGGRVAVAPPAIALDGAALAGMIEASGVTHAQLTPSGWRVLLDAGFTGPDVTALAGGEALPLPLAQELRSRVRRLWNMYGPTETTIWSTAWEVPERPGHVSIGRPIAGTRVHVVDAGLRRLPAGVPGELAIGGIGVAEGYLGRPELTARKFVPDPYGPPGGRLYRTGDTVRRRHDGTLEFLGRSDDQVKLRGHRIELGEIETALAAQPGVRQAVVAVHRETLVAYVIGRADAAALADRLPAYMLPSVYVPMDAFPLTPNGKLDRKALPAPEPRARAAGRPPESPAERRVAAVFAEVLGHERGIGADDDFFALGGHSLLATKVVARLAGTLGVRVPVRELFTHPTVAGLAAVAERADASAAPYGPRPEGAAVPLSAAQERLWFLHRFDPADTSFNVYLVRRVHGPLDAGALDDALAGLTARHEGLRTRYPHDEGTPLAVVEPASPTRFERAVAADEDEARRLVADRVNAPFDLAAAPPFRATLVSLSPVDHVVCVVSHHIAADGWSLTILLDDLAALYGAARRGLPPDLPPQTLQPGDVAYWRRLRDDHSDGHDEHDAALAYWRERLRTLPALDLPADRPRPATGARRSGSHRLVLPGDLAAALERTGREHGATLFMVLLAAYQVLLSRHSGQDDFAVGSPTAGRDRVELERVVGYLTNTLVLRADLAGDVTFAELLGRVRRTVLDAHTHQEIPFERLLAALGVERDTGRTPLFQTMLILHSQETLASRPFDGLPSEPFDAGGDHAKYDVMLEAWRGEGDLTLLFGYDADLFDAATIENLAGRLAVLLAGVVTGPGLPVSALPMRTAADDALLTRLGGGPRLGDAPVTGRADARATGLGDAPVAGHTGAPVAGLASASPAVPELIADAARRTPGAVAVECGGERTTYAELVERARRLASPLRGHDLVGVCLGRSPGTVVALLAAWHAGAAYLPLDPEYPAERLAALVRDAGVTLVVTDQAHRTRLPAVATVEVDAAGRAIGTGGPAVGGVAGEPAGAGRTGAAGDGGAAVRDGDPALTGAPGAGGTLGGSAAYVIYTSGSTGAPKGVVVEHGGLAARVRWMRDAYELGPGDRVVQFASLSFDTHAEEIFPALAAGATVVMLPDGGASLPDHLAASSAPPAPPGSSGSSAPPVSSGVTVLDLPTAYWHRLVDLIDEIRWPESLRLVILGGEQVHGAAVARWRARFGDRVRLVNTYGPTETTIIATATDLDDDGGARPPLGWPIAETSVHVLDPRGAIVPPGVPGELCVGGAGVARGYLARPGLTAERFVPDPFGPPGSRLYRTGDRARVRADGRLEFLGRLDAQVKVRGYRVEPGEVEARLLAHPGVGEAAVVVRDDTLVAFVTGSASFDDLRRHAAETLPPHMVPGLWTRLDRLPLTTGGKVDRRALPDVERERETRFVEPRTDAERLVADIWAEVLDLERVGALDDFFHLGGHSLLAVRVTARLRADVEVDMPIRTIFARRTVAELAAALEELLLEELEGLSDEEALRLLETAPDSMEGL
ncbi:amino acid adenylation domain-containing protein [Sphaerisporangium album]|uniref:Amino acid adenylation domain-containing protein n=1 Tax=Sphaerisporangium album TaxID=509200 RepID=A0A367FS78_9ACTN|nr:non-ribosomal peptide synthetase [Sphaerisporangium album]RCG33248.1 amino acid adenylation domain-containing protein [Sphaerisporangium album]